MRALPIAAVLVVLIFIASAPARSADAPEPTVLHPESLEWMDRGAGVQVAVLRGDPASEGTFTLRLRYPAGYRKGPHFHPADAQVTVLEGRYFRAYGTVFDESKGIPLTPGTFSINPAGVSHYEWTLEPATLQVTATGPWSTVYVDSDGLPVPDEDEGGRHP